MRDTLLVPLRKKEEQEQPGELAEGDDQCFKPTGSGMEKLGQCLA